MLLYLQIDPIDTLASATVKNYPAMTSATGSPFSGGSLSHLGSGVYSINIGSITGFWIVHGLNAGGELLAYGYASDQWVDGSGNGTVYDSPPWLGSATVGIGGDADPGSTTIEVKQGSVASITKTCVDEDGNAVTLTGLTTKIVIEDLSGTDVEVIASGSITISGTDFTFTPASGTVASEKIMRWALINTANSKPLMYGLFQVTYSSQDDP